MPSIVFEWMRLPRIRLRTLAESVMMPFCGLNAIRLPSVRPVPPMVLSEASVMKMPCVAFGSAPSAVGDGADQVAEDRVVGGPGALEAHAAEAVARDQVAFTGARAADRVAGDVAVDVGEQPHAVCPVRQRRGAVSLDADVIANHPVVRDVLAILRVEDDAMLPVAGDDVAIARLRATDGVAGRAEDEDTGTGVAETSVAARVGADEVALDRVAGADGIDTRMPAT